MNEFTKKSITSAKLENQTQADLLAEQARIVARLAEITAILSSDNPIVSQNTPPKQLYPKEFDRKAYAVGLIWLNPSISTQELAKKVGVNRTTLYLPSWSDVAKVLRARMNLSIKEHKDYHLDEDMEDNNELDS
ncbi:MAG: hypothetical protein A2Y10_08705 [Planctomycetes bacterium GWF2_41_51]|nr:MAG: hypothetical protein A2Y10_08705 [Planctomycetes bacterium GWF2_41_51]HBG28365.1 hypothetical protein [Phycisphaerales bacterium]